MDAFVVADCGKGVCAVCGLVVGKLRRSEIADRRSKQSDRFLPFTVPGVRIGKKELDRCLALGEPELQTVRSGADRDGAIECSIALLVLVPVCRRQQGGEKRRRDG